MTQQKPPESCASPIILNEFMNSLQRLFKIGIYYPSGHSILDKATDRFIDQLSALAGDNLSITLQDHGNTLLLEGVELDATLPFIHEFKSMLTALGISAITIDRDISAGELHQFIREMRSYSSRVISAKQFTQVEIADLPSSISVRLKEFLARNDGLTTQDGADHMESIGVFIESLTKYGLSTEEISQCRLLLETLPERLAHSRIEISDLPYASWDDVARLLAHTVSGGKQPIADGIGRRSAQDNINALASILQKLERETTDKKSRDTINLFVSIIKKPLTQQTQAEEKKPPSAKRTFPDTPDISVQRIQQFADKKCLHPKILAGIPRLPTGNETLSILMMLARHDQPLQNQIHMQQLFREILTTEITEKTWEILSNGLQQLITHEEKTGISSIIRMVVEPLRRSKYGNSLHLFHRTLALCREGEKKKHWPYIVNEILVEGGGKDLTAYRHLCLFAAGFSQEEMQKSLSDLQSLDAFQNKNIASDIFLSVSPTSYGLFAFLLKTDLEHYIGERVLGGLRRSAPDWLIKALAPLLDLSLEEHKLFLYSYLRLASQKILPLSLKSVAAKIVTDCLSTLPKEKRGETWVPETIAALSQLPKENVTALLERIIGSKKMLVFADWPTECRKAAESAKLAMKKQR